MTKTIKSLTLVALSVTILMACSSHENNMIGNDNDLFAVKQGDKWGFINHKGEYVINPQFTHVGFFSEGVAMVGTGWSTDRRYGLIDEKGKFLMPLQYTEASSFSDGCIWMVKPECAPDLIDKSGKVIMTYTKGRYMHPFHEGMAIVEGDGDMKWAIDKKGKTICALGKGLNFDSNFHDGLAVLKEEHYGGKKGYINNKGEIVIDCKFEEAYPFFNGKAIVCLNRQYGVINKEGKFVINPQFQFMMVDNDKYIIGIGGKFGWCNEKGKIIINPQFERAFPFGNSNLAPVMSGNKWGYVDKKGKFAINPQYDYALPFNDDVAIVVQNDKHGLINKKGNYIANPQFEKTSYPLTWTEIFKSTVTSQYFDVKGIIHHIASLFADGKFNGKKISEMSISEFRQKYNLKNKNRAEIRYSRDLSYSITAHGTFTREVSDGWWGIEIQEMPNAKLDYLSLDINLSKKAKTTEVAEGIATALQVKDGRNASGLYIQFVKDIDPATGGFRTLTMKVSDKPIKK